MEEDLIGILGAGGQADETASFLKEEPLFRAVEREYVSDGCVAIEDLTDEMRQAEVVIAVGAPAVKLHLSKVWLNDRYTTVISDAAYVSESTVIGDGSTVAPKSVLSTNVQIGRHVLINIAATISHDTKIGDYTTISPGVHIAGKVSVGRGVFIGIGAVISNGVTIADGAVIGAGAVVLSDIETENAVVVGVPAKVLRINQGWLREI